MVSWGIGVGAMFDVGLVGLSNNDLKRWRGLIYKRNASSSEYMAYHDS